MAEDPRKFVQEDCSDGGEEQGRKTGFFGSLGKLGDLEVLNEIDTDIGQGLRVLETISEQVRTGKGVPAIFQDREDEDGNVIPGVITSIEAGADTVLSTVGIDPKAARSFAGRFNPAVANRAFGTAEQIYDRVKQGNYEVKDIPGALQEFGNLNQQLGGVFTPKPGEQKQKFSFKDCDPSPYARDLIALAPKHKFMFVVEFIFNDEFQDKFKDIQKQFAFVVKRSTRPNMNFEYEDINYYNFRTKVLKKSEYQPMTMTFYDDMTDNVLKFYARYMQIISPISRSVGDGTSQLFEESGMTFTQGGVNSASIQAVSDTAKTIIDYINLYHVVYQGRFVDVYRFDNPRLQTMTLDDLDMADSTGSEVTLEFNYDGLYVAPAQSILTKEGNVRDKTDVGLFPLGPEVSAAGGGTGGDSQDATKIDDQQPATGKGHYTFLGGAIPCETWQQDLQHFEAQRIRVLNTPLSEGGAQGDLSHVKVLPLTKVIKEIRDSGEAGGCAGVPQIRT